MTSSWQFTPYTAPLLFNSAILFMLAWLVWRRRQAPGAVPMAWLLLAGTVWALAYAMRLSSANLSGMLFWGKVQFAGIVILPIAGLALVLQFTRRSTAMRPRMLALASVVPAIYLALVATDELHGLVWASTELVDAGSFVIMAITPGPAFSLFWTYLTGVLLISAALLVRAYILGSQLERAQIRMLLIAAAIPWAANAVSLIGPSPLPYLDLAPFSFSLVGIITFWSLFRHRLLQVWPLAGDITLAHMSDGVIVLNPHNRISQINPATAHLLARPEGELVGQDSNTALPPDLARIVSADMNQETSAEIVIDVDGRKRFLHVNVRAIVGTDNASLGVLIHLRDVTQQHLLDTERKWHAERLRILHSVDSALMGATEQGQIQERVLAIVCEVFGPQLCAIVLEDALAQPARIVAQGPLAGLAAALLERGRLPSLVEWTLSTRQTVLATDLGREQPFHVPSFLSEPGAFSSIATPLVVEERALGVLVVCWRHPQKPSDQEDRLLALIANSTSQTLERARLLAEARHRASELAALYATSLDITSRRRLSELLPAIVERAASLLDVPMGGLYLLRPDGQSLELVVSYRLREGVAGAVLQLGEGLSGRVAQTGEPIMVSDYSAWEYRAAMYEGSPFRRVLGVPLKVEGRVIGVLNVTDDRDLGPFSDAEVGLVRLFAEQAAIAIENVRLLESELEHSELAESLRTSGMILASTLDAEELLDRLLDQIARVVPFDSANVMLLEGNKTYVARARGYERFSQAAYAITRDITFDLDSTANLRRMAETRQPLVISDVRQDEDWIQVPDLDFIGSWAGMPIIVEDEVVGFFSLDKVESGFYQPHHALRLMAFTGQAAIAIANARLYQAARRRASLSSRLAQISEKLNRPFTTQGVIEAIGDGILALLQPDKAALFMFTTDPPQCVWNSGLSNEYVRSCIDHRHQSPAFEALLAKEPVSVADIQELPANSSYRQLHELYGQRAIGFWPVVYEDASIAAVACYFSAPRRFTAEEDEVMRSFCRQVAVALENARLFEAERSRLLLAQTLHAVGALLTTEMGVQEVLERILDLVQDVVPYDSASIQLLDGKDCLHLMAGRGFDDLEYVRQKMEAISDQILNKLLDTGNQAMIIRDTLQDERWVVVDDIIHIRSWVGAPLLIKNRLIGVLNLDSCTPNVYEEETGQVAMAFANQAAVAIENARLYAQVQQALRIREQILQNVSHELRTPLTIIQGYAEMVLSAGSQPGVSTDQGLQIIMNQARHLHHLVDQLLAMQGIEKAKLELHPFAIDEWLAAVGLGWKPVFRSGRKQLKVDLAPDLGMIYGDRDYLEQVVNNLLSNALKFSNGGGTVRLSAWSNGDEVTISVADDGIGIPEDKLPLLFDRFYQVEASTSRRYKGLGLGLSLARAIVERHGGHIWAESEGTGRGATILFSLPVQPSYDYAHAVSNLDEPMPVWAAQH